jgi:hypothetical protein
MTRQCAWCGQVLNLLGQGEDAADSLVTHTICLPCIKRLEADTAWDFIDLSCIREAGLGSYEAVG